MSFLKTFSDKGLHCFETTRKKTLRANALLASGRAGASRSSTTRQILKRRRSLKRRKSPPKSDATFKNAARSTATLTVQRLVFDLREEEFAVQAGDVRDRDAFRAFGFAGLRVRAGTETEFVHLRDHRFRAAGAFDFPLRELREGGNAGGDEEHRGAVFARRDAGAATDARRRVHRFVRVDLADRQVVRVRNDTVAGDETAGLKDLVERVAVDDQVFNDRETDRAPRFDRDRVAVLELAHMELASGDSVVRAVRVSVDVKRTHTADAFAAVVVERDRLFAFADELVVQNVQHFEEGGVRRNVVDAVGFETPLGFRVLLTPNLQFEFHCYVFMLGNGKRRAKRERPLAAPN